MIIINDLFCLESQFITLSLKAKLREKELYLEIFTTQVVEKFLLASRWFLTIDWVPLLLIYFLGLEKLLQNNNVKEFFFFSQRP